MGGKCTCRLAYLQSLFPPPIVCLNNPVFPTHPRGFVAKVIAETPHCFQITVETGQLLCGVHYVSLLLKLLAHLCPPNLGQSRTDAIALVQLLAICTTEEGCCFVVPISLMCNRFADLAHDEFNNEDIWNHICKYSSLGWEERRKVEVVVPLLPMGSRRCRPQVREELRGLAKCVQLQARLHCRPHHLPHHRQNQ
jgi:hypothetical protein